MGKNIIYGICLLFLMFTSCINNGEEILILNPLAFSKDEFKLSNISDDITYIPFDNTIPIGEIYSMKINKQSFFISTKNPGILHFDNNGKFIRIVARKGKGPNEYLYGMRFAVDEKSNRLYVATKSKIRIYSLTGNLIKDISTSDYFDGVAGDIEIFNSHLFLANYGTFGDFKFNWIIMDTQGNVISKKYSTDHPAGFMLAGNEYIFENKLYYFNYLNDTIFAIQPDLHSKVAYLFGRGDYRFPNNLVLNSTSQLFNYFIPKNMLESKHFVFLQYSFKDKWTTLLIDKKTKRTYQGFKEKIVNGVVYSEACILNDLDGGLPLSPKPLKYYYYTSKGVEYIIGLINPFELKEYISSIEFKNASPKFPEKKKELEKLAASLNENDNPVLMLVKLKK
jgi:hypothetical protein